jgi:hypothetical protein
MMGASLAHSSVMSNLGNVSFGRRVPQEIPIDPEITAELRAADEEARQEFAERSVEVLERLRSL